MSMNITAHIIQPIASPPPMPIPKPNCTKFHPSKIKRAYQERDIILGPLIRDAAKRETNIDAINKIIERGNIQIQSGAWWAISYGPPLATKPPSLIIPLIPR